MGDKRVNAGGRVGSKSSNKWSLNVQQFLSLSLFLSLPLSLFSMSLPLFLPFVMAQGIVRQNCMGVSKCGDL